MALYATTGACSYQDKELELIESIELGSSTEELAMSAKLAQSAALVRAMVGENGWSWAGTVSELKAAITKRDPEAYTEHLTFQLAGRTKLTVVRHEGRLYIYDADQRRDVARLVKALFAPVVRKDDIMDDVQLIPAYTDDMRVLVSA